ncbi:MAG: mechanosensitive ion channel family protein, partial [Halobacteria archaeon]|nr:mechanosensitive ion channel family protein [Halobacteria archaeon]
MSVVTSLLNDLRNLIIDKYLPLGEQFAEFAVVTVILYAVGRIIVVPVVEWAVGKTSRNETLRGASGSITRGGVFIVVLSVGAGVAGFQNALVGSALVIGVVTFTVGLAAQDILGNFVSGVFLIQHPKLNVGDYIEWDGKSGKIRDIGLRVTCIRTMDNETVIVPNSELTSNPVTNSTVNDPIGISYDFGIGYDDDVDEARNVVFDVADELENVLDEPEPTANVVELADNAVIIKARIWVEKKKRYQRAKIRSKFIRRVNERSQEVGIDLSTTTQHALMGEIGVRESEVSEA